MNIKMKTTVIIFRVSLLASLIAVVSSDRSSSSNGGMDKTLMLEFDEYQRQYPQQQQHDGPFMMFDTDDNNDHANYDNVNDNDALVCRDSSSANIILFDNQPYSCNQLPYLSLVQPTLYNSICTADKSRSSPHCPIACGVCCEDDADYQMGTHNGLEMKFYDCEWLKEGEDANGYNLRADYLCGMYNNGMYISQGCPLTCGICEEQEQMDTQEPSSVPSVSAIPTDVPSDEPSSTPTVAKSDIPSMSQMPSFESDIPSTRPTVSSQPSGIPSRSPTSIPTVSSQPSKIPSQAPTSIPTISSSPTSIPSSQPSMSVNPTKNPTQSIKPSPTPTGTPTSTTTPSTNPTSAPTQTQPNLIMILTDEHNYRTINCYREHLLSKNTYTPEQVNVWGDSPDLIPSTPHLDKLASEGALYSNFYSVSPLCTPSRASFMTGLYPTFVGDAKGNHGVLGDDLVTWAEVLRKEGYRTGYMGKWHLDGRAKPGWDTDRDRPFGFTHNQYRWNRGHWKYLDEDVNGTMHSYTMDHEGTFHGVEAEHFTTDFLINRGIEFVEQATDDNVPFALVISIPDPHGPNENRPEYRDMFDHLFFQYPESARRNMKYDPPAPGFNYLSKDTVPVLEVDAWVDKYEQGRFWQTHMRQYYGMVKCIDDNVGKLMKSLQESGIDDDTIVVFTSDHGDQLMEHGKLNKGRPYEGSAGVPFLIRWPDVIPAGKVVETARSSVDFAPTILSLMGVDVDGSDSDATGMNFQGVDASQDLLSTQKLIKDGSQIVISFTTERAWVAAIKDGYKYIVQANGEPWLYDLNIDPEEMVNQIDSWFHTEIVDDLRNALVEALSMYKIPITESVDTLFLDMPACFNSRSVIPEMNKKGLFCSDIGTEVLPSRKCGTNHKVRNHCPLRCGNCQCADSDGPIWHKGSVYKCSEIDTTMCTNQKVNLFCPKTCGNMDICSSLQ